MLWPDVVKTTAADHGIVKVQSSSFAEGLESELWFTEVRDRQGIGPCFAREVKNHKWIGDDGSAAVFFLERYLPIEPEFSVDDLMLVAAHVVLVMGKLNSGGVGGLEMVLCRDGAEHYERVSGV